MAADNAAAALPLPLPLHGFVVIVTGSSRGICRAIALHLASLGANRVINYSSNFAQADAVAASLVMDFPIGPEYFSCQHHVLFVAAYEAFRLPVHVLVNSAGVLDSKYPSIANTTVEDFDRTFNINARGSFLFCKEVANRLKRGGSHGNRYHHAPGRLQLRCSTKESSRMIRRSIDECPPRPGRRDQDVALCLDS